MKYNTIAEALEAFGRDEITLDQLDKIAQEHVANEEEQNQLDEASYLENIGLIVIDPPKK